MKFSKQWDLAREMIKRLEAEEFVSGNFFRMQNQYIFLGQYKYWFMVPHHKIDVGKENYALNRALLFKDSRDFSINSNEDMPSKFTGWIRKK